MASRSKSKFYAVIKGRKTGIFTNWSSCERQIKGYKGAIFKAYTTRGEAEAALAQASTGNFPGDQPSRSSSRPGQLPEDRAQILLPSLSVDASCLGNPGLLEYRGVTVDTHEEVFREGPFPNGTNNIGEFLAIVEALRYLTARGQAMPIYSDSEIAILWVRKKKARTTLVKSTRNQGLFDRIEAAQTWLQEHGYSNPILKWHTAAWGEIPADFGRK